MSDEIDEALTEYAIEHLDWPETPAQLDEFIEEFSSREPAGETESTRAAALAAAASQQGCPAAALAAGQGQGKERE